MTHAELLGRVTDILVANGFGREVAVPIARTICACERDGTLSHGLMRLPAYVESVRTGWADGTVLPEVLSKSPSMIVVDARNGFTHLALAQSRADLVERAGDTGCAILLIRNAHHLAALWPDIEGFADQGLIAMACVTSKARVVGWGGGKPVFGTNASAFACPRSKGPPIVWDQAASIMSQGELLRYSREGRELPEGVGVDPQGRPTTDPKAILEGGALLPFGGVKGASIAFMVEVLAAALSGGPFGIETSPKGTLPSKCGEFILVIDPRRAGTDVGARVETLVDAIKTAGSAHMPGSRRHERRARAEADGIALDAHSLEILERLGSESTRGQSRL
jgi:delta1-piperideine-2-carboxylate reductase